MRGFREVQARTRFEILKMLRKDKVWELLLKLITDENTRQLAMLTRKSVTEALNKVGLSDSSPDRRVLHYYFELLLRLNKLFSGYHDFIALFRRIFRNVQLILANSKLLR